MSYRTWALGALVLFVVGCAPKLSEIVVLRVGPHQVNLAEYENFFSRNSGGWESASNSTPEERERFLDLLVKYKLKVLDANDKNLLNDPEIRQELKEYRSSLGATYLIEKEITEPGVQLLYERKKEEIRAMHILIALKPGAAPDDTLKAYNKAVGILRRIQAGERFDSLAMRYSEDPSVRSNLGDLYYFSGGHMQMEFENAAFGMKKGEVSAAPVRTQHGYHIIKITDRQPARGAIRVRHMMARFMASQTDSADTASALARVIGMQDSLKKGWNFEALAKKLSEDPGSQNRGGDLGWFERRSFVQSFEEAAFNLKMGETSEIVRTQYGYHLIRCDSIKPVPSLAESREELKKKYQQYRFNEDYRAYIEALKKKFSVRIDWNVFESFLSALDSNYTSEDSAWDAGVSSELRQQPLVITTVSRYPVEEFIHALSTRMEFQGTFLRKHDLTDRLEKTVEAVVLDDQSAGMEQRFPEFGSLMREYEDGVILFKAEQIEVWNNIAVSDSVLRDYFEKNRNKFLLPERVGLKEIFVESDTLAVMLYDSLMQGVPFEDLAFRHNADDELKAHHGDRGLVEVTVDTLAEIGSAMAIGEISQPLDMDVGYSIIMVTAKEPEREKTFEEAGAEVSNSYQEYESKRLEHNWLERVRQKYSVQMFKDNLRSAFMNSPASN